MAPRLLTIHAASPTPRENSSASPNYIIAGIYEFNRSSVNLFTKVGFAREPELDETEENVFGEGQIVQLGFRLNRQI